jgi:4-amino-4-deoxy-L-arabinose transferase-like glycosyltransferase
MRISPSRGPYIAALAIVVAFGGWLRISDLDRRSVTHPELYVPGIPLPAGVSVPAERVSVQQVLTGTFSSDTHPPGYYLFMFPWTRAFGASLRAIRLPSALLGIGSVVLLYILGTLTVGPGAGLVAAGLLAFSGYHVFWSQVARMFSLGCFLGLAATCVLVWMLRDSRRSRGWLALYAVLMLAALATHVFLWSLFAVHLLWAFSKARGVRELPDLCRTQLLVFLLGSQLIAFAAYQSDTTVAVLGRDWPAYLAHFVSLAFVFPSDYSGFFPGPVPLTGGGFFPVLRICVFALAGVFLVIGIRRLTRLPSTAAFPETRGSSRRFFFVGWVLGAIAATAAIAAFIYMTRSLPADQVHPTIATTRRLLSMPAILLMAAVLLNSRWPLMPPPGRLTKWFNSEAVFAAALGLGPFLLIAAASQVRPFLNERGFLFEAPYLLLLLAAGVTRIPRKALLAPVLVVLAAISVTSLGAYRQMTVDPADYTHFATTVKSELQPNDLVFLHRMWYTTPILYYLKADRYRFVGRDYAEASARNPLARVWVVMLYESTPTKEMQAALAGYRPIKTIVEPHAAAILFQRAEKEPGVPNLRKITASLGQNCCGALPQ